MSIVDFNKFRLKKAAEKALAEGKVPLFVDRSKGTISGPPSGQSPDSDDFKERMMRIKASLEKINALMGELKKQTNKKEP